MLLITKVNSITTHLNFDLDKSKLYKNYLLSSFQWKWLSQLQKLEFK